MYNLHIQDSVQVIEKTLRLNGRLADWDYLKDHTFERYVVKGQFHSADEVLAFADHLEAQCKTTCPGVCSKARSIRSYFNRTDDFWRQGDRYLATLAHSRRVMCWGHETGSFYLRQNSGHPTWGQTTFPPLKELIVPDFTYNEDQIILIADNTATLLACVLEITEHNGNLRQFFESGQAVDVIPYRDQVTKDALRREMATLLHFDEDRQAKFWQDAKQHYTEKLTEGVDCKWALPDQWEVPA